MAATRKVLGRAGLVLAYLLVTLLILEATARITAPASVFSPLLPLFPHVKAVLDVDLRGVSPHGRLTTNRWGLRGEEPPEEWDAWDTWVTIGGSTTQCFYLDDEKTWPHLLQQRLRERNPRTWVGNGGIDGQTTRAHLVFMDEVVRAIRPDAVLFLLGVNDFSLSICQDRRLFGNPQDRGAWSEDSWKMRLFRWSRLFQLGYRWSVALSGDVILVRAAHRNYEPTPLGPDPTPVPSDPRDLLPELPEFRSNLKALVESGRAMGVRTVFLTQPILFADADPWRGIEGEFFWIRRPIARFSAADCRRMLDVYNRATVETCRAEGAPCFDLAAEVPSNGDLYYDPAHFTEKGCAFVAEKVAAFLAASPGR
ncbi:MAG TPA: GDSL-type esterase/lipase family protein [Planctomycetota bacterium]|nr:GDSL-type esterase/lipase family protein [Planctomycetota bacterium]